MITQLQIKRKLAAAEAVAADWNAAHPVGTPVTRYALVNPLREPKDTYTRSEAWVLGHGAVVVKVDGVAGGVLLESLVLRQEAAACPYCGADVEINHDDGAGYDESETHQQECHACDKTFVFTTAISFDYRVNKADCLNGGEHQFKPTATYPKEYTKLRCEVCGETKEMDKLPA